HEPILARAAERPEAPAVIDVEGTLSYGQLATLGHTLATELRGHQVAPGNLVAVVLPKGRYHAVATLGVLEAGGAYLPIDPGQPQDRIWYLLDEGLVDVVVTDAENDRGLAWPTTVARVVVDRLVDELPPVDAAPPTPLEPIQRPDDLAYVIFTSGSTGRPKGVMIDHRGALNTCIDVNSRFDIGPDDVVFAISALNFDLSVWDLFGVLGAGGAVVMPEPATLREPEHWLRLAEAHGVTTWNSVPALVQMLVDYAEDTDSALPTSLRLVLMSGDWIPIDLPDRLRRLLPEIELISMGGATEASIWSILYPIAEVDPEWKSIPYGRPMVNQRFYVLGQSETLDPKPEQVVGDLYIGGIGLAKGYWRDQEKTRAAFFHHPSTGERLYRTGDLGRWLPSGEIEFLGREDTQVKVQGHRIELGEIEAALAQVPGVLRGVVVAVGERRGAKRLVGYVVLDDAVELPGDGPAPERLRVALAESLPSYMLPTLFVFLDALPLSANGKVDRKALPAPEQAEGAAAERREPTTPLEQTLADAWAEVLGEAPSIDDNFFELGGDSVLATRALTRLRGLFPVEIGLRDLFEAPTVVALAEVIDTRMVEMLDAMSDDEAESLIGS
ncbi:MAG: amino acid adenylation domain-containing protein, partial [Acidobacteriota bacterium]